MEKFQKNTMKQSWNKNLLILNVLKPISFQLLLNYTMNLLHL